MRITLALIVILIIQIYFFRKINKSFKITFPKINPKKISKFVLAGVIFLNIYPFFLIGIRLYSDIADKPRPEMPDTFLFDYLLVYPFWILAFVIIQSIIYFIILAIIKYLLLPLYYKNKERLRKTEAKTVLVIVAFFILYVPIRIIYDFNTVSLRYIEYSKKGLPEELHNFKIGFISDIQADKYTDGKRLDRFINTLNSAKPDLVLIAGDIITSTPNYINTAAEYLSKIESKYGIYSCVGDHDNWAYRGFSERSIREITEALAKKDIKMINNDRLVLNVMEADIGITFVTNTYVERITVDKLNQLTDGNFNHDLKIFLTHQPREHLIQNALSNKYDLFLAGHTHGGQVTFLFPFITLSPTLVETPYVRGDFYFDDMLMVVTRGLGMSLIPIRFNSTPEVTVIQLKSIQ